MYIFLPFNIYKFELMEYENTLPLLDQEGTFSRIPGMNGRG